MIAESGSILEHWALEEDPIEASYIIARNENIKCLKPDETPQTPQDLRKLGNCMRKAPAEALLDAVTNLVVSCEIFYFFIILEIKPVIGTRCVPLWRSN